MIFKHYFTCLLTTTCAIRAAGDNLVEAEPFAQTALFTAHTHDKFQRRGFGSHSSARRLMNVHGWLNEHIGGLLPPRRHSLTRRNLRAQNKPVSSKDAHTSKEVRQVLGML